MEAITFWDRFEIWAQRLVRNPKSWQMEKETFFYGRRFSMSDRNFPWSKRVVTIKKIDCNAENVGEEGWINRSDRDVGRKFEKFLVTTIVARYRGISIDFQRKGHRGHRWRAPITADIKIESGSTGFGSKNKFSETPWWLVKHLKF